MKSSKISIPIILLSISILSHSQGSKNEPKDMVFIPSGSFDALVNIDGKEIIRTVSVDAFWMSNEITNEEYRTFINDIKQHPDYELNWIDFKSMAEDEIQPTKESMQKYLIAVKYADIVDKLIDMEKQPFELYFSEKRYNESPVVGVSQQAAKYYCIWRTSTENNERQVKGLPLIQNYRLPIEAEWEYAAMGQNESKRLIQNYPIPVKSGKKNQYGLNHMLDNVAEWTINYSHFRDANNEAVIKGGTAKEEAQATDRQTEDPNHTDQWLGFRIVRSYISPAK